MILRLCCLALVLVGSGYAADLGPSPSPTIADGNLSANVPLKNAANTFTAAQTVNLGNTESLLALGNSTNGWATIRLLAGSTHPAWIVAAQNNITNAVEITPSTTNGGTTFTTPAFTVSSTATTAATGDLVIGAVGKGLQVKEGANARMGTSALTGGAVTVANTSVTASTRIFLESNADGGTPGWLRVSARVASTSFTITSSSGTDTSTVAWVLVEPSP